MLVFDNQTQREQYRINGDEVFMALRGALIAYERNTHTTWKPKSAGSGAAHWEQVSGAQKPRAYGGTMTERRGEWYASDLTVRSGDDYIVIDDITIDADSTIDGELSFRVLEGAYYQVGVTLLYGELDAEPGEMTIDGEIVQLPTHEEMDISMVRTGAVELQYGSLTLDTQKTIDGELIFVRSYEEQALPLTPQEIGYGEKLTIPAGYQMMIAGAPTLNGELDCNGELA